MFERVRNPPEKFPTNPHDETDEFNAYEKLDKKVEKQLNRRNSLPVKLGATALSFLTLSSVYWSDVQENRAEQAVAEVSINLVGQPLEESNSNKATILIDGFNTYDADYLAKTIGPAIQQVADGQLWSMSYNNALLSREQIYKKIVDMVNEHGVDSISFAGYSMGGIIATEAASDMIVDTNTEVNSLMLMSTPDGYDGLQSYQKNEFAVGQALVKWSPSAIDSTYVRFGGELYFYHDNYTKGEFKAWNLAQNAEVITDNIGRFARTFDSLWGKVNNPKGTSMKLMSEQVYKIAQSDIKKELERIAAVKDTKQMPVISYYGMNDDETIKNQLTAKNYRTYTTDTGIDFYGYLVPDAKHSQYYRSVDEYMRVFGEASAPISIEVQAETERHALYLEAQQEISVLAVEK